jgi:NAD-dependent deacetylase
MNIVILTGAGISAESGLSTFRDPQGLWSRHDWRDVATPEGFARDPAGVHAFYNMRRAVVLGSAPNAAHHALARLQLDHPGQVTLVTQNVDRLHEAAGSQDVIHMHGTHARALCAACTHRWDAPGVMTPDDACPDCGTVGRVRPDVVWFGERPYHLPQIHEHLERADLFVSVGTSGTVQPAAGFVRRAARAGARTLELNLEPSARAALFDDGRYGPATEVVPDWVDATLRAVSAL